jgi:hypothetical protein
MRPKMISYELGSLISSVFRGGCLSLLGGKAATATVAVGEAYSSDTVNIHSVHPADVYTYVSFFGFLTG